MFWGWSGLVRAPEPPSLTDAAGALSFFVRGLPLVAVAAYILCIAVPRALESDAGIVGSLSIGLVVGVGLAVMEIAAVDSALRIWENERVGRG